MKKVFTIILLFCLSFLLLACSDEKPFLDITVDNILSISLITDGETVATLDQLSSTNDIVSTIENLLETYEYNRYADQYLNVATLNGSNDSVSMSMILITTSDENYYFTDLAVSGDNQTYHLTYITDGNVTTYGFTEIGLLNDLISLFSE